MKEHFEVNVAPLTIQLTARFYRTVMAYFFREKPDDTEYEDPGLCIWCLGSRGVIFFYHYGAFFNNNDTGNNNLYTTLYNM